MKHIKLLPMALLSLFVLKALVLGAGLADLGVIAVLAGYAAYLEKARDEAFMKDVLEKLETHRKGFENVDSFITKLFANDKELTTAIQKIQLPQTVKNNGFGRM